MAKRRWPPRRVFLVLCDHSVASVRPTKKAAQEEIRWRLRGANEAAYYVVGPYVLEEEGQ